MAKWYYKVLGDVVGPLSSRDFLERVRAGEVTEEMHVRKDDAMWVQARAVTGLFEYATERSAETVCPYCGSSIDPPPTRCAKCRRRISVSYEARAGATQTRVETAAQQMQVGEHANEQQPDTVAANVAVITGAVFLALTFAFLVSLGFRTSLSWIDGAILGLLVIPAASAAFVFYLQSKYRNENENS